MWLTPLWNRLVKNRGELCRIFQSSFLQSNSVNNLCELLQFLGEFIPRPPTGASPVDPTGCLSSHSPLSYNPQMKIPGADTAVITRLPFNRRRATCERSYIPFCSCDLDLDAMTLIYELVRRFTGIPTMKSQCQGFQKLEHAQCRQTDATEHISSRNCARLLD